MEQSISLLLRLSQNETAFSKGQKKLSEYLKAHYEEASFMTAAALAEKVGVSESTVLRLSARIGYESYSDFKKALGDILVKELHSVKDQEPAYETMNRSQILETVLLRDCDRLQRTLEKIDREAFSLAIDSLISANEIYVMGIRSCAPSAEFLGFYLKQIFPRVHVVNTNNASEIFEQLLRIGEKDVIIGISFPRYSMRTLKALEFANERKAGVITLTDSIHSPVNLYSSCNLIAESGTGTILDSQTAAISLINALIIALCMELKDQVIRNLDELDRIWADYQVYGSDEMNLFDDDPEENGLNL